jgi:hypothetical protein
MRIIETDSRLILCGRAVTGMFRRASSIASLERDVRVVWTLGVLTLGAVCSAGAQRPRETTVGRLLTFPVDTIEADRSFGGDGWGQGSRLALVRTDSGFVGRVRVYLAKELWAGGPMRCDTTLAVRLTPSIATRLLGLIDRVAVAPGAPPGRIPVYDAYWDDRLRLSGPRRSVEIRDDRAVVLGDSAYHVLIPRTRESRRPPPSPMVEARRMVEVYLRADLVDSLNASCRGK